MVCVCVVCEGGGFCAFLTVVFVGSPGCSGMKRGRWAPKNVSGVRV